MEAKLKGIRWEEILKKTLNFENVSHALIII